MTPIKHIIAASLIISTLGGCATAIVGGAAAGANSIANRRTIGTQFDDETTEMHIRTNAKALIKQNNPNSTATLSVISYNRKVLLLGQVLTETEKQLAEQAARNEPQVQNVYNYINVSSEPRTVANINYDTWLTSKLRSKLLTLTTSGVYPGHVKVVSFNSVVYVFGLLTPEQQTLVSNTVSSVAGVQQVVTLYETYTPASVQSTPAQ
nr:BON domain-containing protein [uncultured Kingella sp.]